MRIRNFISDNDCLWGITPENEIMFKKSFNEKAWQKVPGSLNQISASELGVFGSGLNAEVYYRVGTYKNPTSIGTEWQR